MPLETTNNESEKTTIWQMLLFCAAVVLAIHICIYGGKYMRRTFSQESVVRSTVGTIGTLSVVEENEVHFHKVQYFGRVSAVLPMNTNTKDTDLVHYRRSTGTQPTFILPSTSDMDSPGRTSFSPQNEKVYHERSFRAVFHCPSPDGVRASNCV